MSKRIHGGEGQDNDDQLELYTLGRLPASETERIEEHLLICDCCRDRLDEIAAFAFSAREALKEMPPEPRASSWRGLFRLPDVGLWRPGLAIACAFAVLTLAAGMYRVRRGGPLAPVTALQLAAVRAEGIPVVAPSRVLDIHLVDARDASRVIIVNDRGSIVWSGGTTHAPADTNARVQTALPEGEYSVRAYTDGGRLMHAYEFRIAR
ncbi:MAG TPA: hypothetical protein VKB79_16075 [Bryobacteraceae bacterium]|nr:hypothetical protein [Bryobacteraceae bacterium]